MWKARACLMPLPHNGSKSPYIYCSGWGLRSSQRCVLQGDQAHLTVSEEQWGQQSVCFGHFCNLPLQPKEEWDDVIKVSSIFVVVVVPLYALFMTFFFTHREITASRPPINLLSTRTWCQPHFWGHCDEELRAPVLRMGMRMTENGAALNQAWPLNFSSLQQWHG